jgi:hypothetical protein
MSNAGKIFQMMIRGTGLLQIAIGIAIWTRHGSNLTLAHTWIGFLFVLCLWTLAVLGARARVGGGLVVMALVWGVVTVLFGMTQAKLLPGAHHWLIRVLHLLVGLAAMGQGEVLGGRIKRSGVRQASGPQPLPAG